MKIKNLSRSAESDEPSIRWKIKTQVLGESPSSKSIKALREKIRNSPRVKTLLSRRDTKGSLPCGSSVYANWQGAHWVMASLADIGYPPGDKTTSRPGPDSRSLAGQTLLQRIRGGQESGRLPGGRYSLDERALPPTRLATGKCPLFFDPFGNRGQALR